MSITLNKPKLLLADDSTTIRKVVELTFADEGIDVTAVGDADSAMQKFVEIQPDIVLVHAGLSGTSGYRICEMIKQDEATRDIPVLLLVGSFEPFDQDEAERVGADGFLTKPFRSIRDLVARVADLLGQETADPEPATDELITSDVGQTDDMDNLYLDSFSETVEIDGFDTMDDLLGDSGMDDEMIEQSHPDGVAVDGIEEAETDEEQTEPIREFDWSAESIIVDSGPDETAVFEPKFVFEDDAEDVEPGPEAVEADRHDDVATAAVTNGETDRFEEPSPEFISIVARRVVEQLSDQVIRDIAEEVVPRLAEKVIREVIADKDI